MKSSKKARTSYDPAELSPEGGYKIKTYRPTLEQMKDFSAYIKHIHDDGGHKAGLAKIIPPEGYNPRKAGYGDDKLYDMEITSPIKQEVSGESGLYQQLNLVDRKKISVRAFKQLAEQKYATPFHTCDEELERIFWKNIFTQPSIYGADVSGSLYDDEVEEFNLTRLNTILDDIGQDYGVTIQGVNTAYLYFGMWKTSFCWHTEDVDLYSINYLHYGQPKSWYCISPEHGKRFERLAASFFPHSFRTCRAFLRHKTTLISPQILKKYSIPFSKITQRMGEFMITFPFSYHSGYNHGFNIAEATNFALEYWIEFGKWATRCECSSESVKISMQTFVKRYQPDRYENWLKGKDVCKDPRDSHIAAAPKPSEYDLCLIGSHQRDEDDLKKANALQQNQSSNVRSKSNHNKKKKGYQSIQETFQRYQEFYLQNSNQNVYQISKELPSFSTIPTNMVPTEPGPYIAIDQPPPKIDIAKMNEESNGMNFAKIRDEYDKIMRETIKNNRKQLMQQEKEEKLRLKRLKRAKETVPRSTEMLQFLPQTFTHEKRFNRCITAWYPHCSVCQLMQSHPKDDENIWGPMKPDVHHVQTTTSQQQTVMIKTEKNTSVVQQTPGISGWLSSTEPVVKPEVDPSESCKPQPTTAGPQVEQFTLPQSAPILLPRGAFSWRWVQTGADQKLVSSPSKLKVSTTQDNQQSSQSSSCVSADKDIKEESAESSPQDVESTLDNLLDFLELDLDSCELIQCSICMLCVHHKCYGLKKLPDSRADWICDRCAQPNRSLITCEICPCRGGALKEYKGTWIHLTCILAIPVGRLKYVDVIEGKDVKFSKDSLVERCNCMYCIRSTGIHKYSGGRTVSCIGYWQSYDQHVSCKNVFHTSCGHRNGARFFAIDSHVEAKAATLIRARCDECARKEMQAGYKEIERPQQELTNEDDSMTECGEFVAGTRVVAMACNGSYYDAEIHEIIKKTTYEVFFPQYSEFEAKIPTKRVLNLTPESRFNIGDPIEIKGFKEGVRLGKYKSEEHTEEYFVRFICQDDGRSQPERVEPNKIYLNIDHMPEELLANYKGPYNTSELDVRAEKAGSDTEGSSDDSDSMQLVDTIHSCRSNM